MKKIIIWLAKVFHVELPKAEVIKEYKWIPLDGKITGNVVIEGDVLIKGNVAVRLPLPDILPQGVRILK